MRAVAIRTSSILSVIYLLICFPTIVRAADDASLTAAVGLASNELALIIKIGVPSGILSGIITIGIAYWNNKAAQKNNREKIAAEAENITRQLAQRQKEFETQTKLQMESLHSDEKKKVCWDFLASVNPSLFPNKQFDFEKMNLCVTPLYLYSKDTYFSYFESLVLFISKRNLSTFGTRYESLNKEADASEKRFQESVRILEARGGNAAGYDAAYYNQETARLIGEVNVMDDILKLYSGHYESAVKAAKSLIWNEPIEKAQPLQLEELPDEDAI